MSVTVVSRPDDFSSAYIPLEYTFSSTYAGRNGVLESVSFNDNTGLTVFAISGTSTSGSVFVPGGIITVTNSPNGLYDGEHVVVKAFSSGLIRVETDFLGNSIGGNASYSRLNATVVCDLYIDDSFVIRKERFANNNDQFVFDFRREIQPNIGNDLKPLALSTNTVAVSPESSKSVYVKYADSFNEDIEGSFIPSSSLPTFTDLIVDDSANAITVINSTVPFLEWELGSVRGQLMSISTGLSDFVVDTIAPTRFLTNSPKTIPIGRNDSYQLSFVLDYDGAKSYRRTITAYNSIGVQVGVANKTISVGADSVLESSCGTRDIGAGTIPATTSYYEVKIKDVAGGGGDISEVITFEINDKCNGTETRFVWLNPRGGYDAFTFTSPRKLSSSVSKLSYSKSRAYPVDISDREESIIDVSAKDTITTGTNKVTKEIAEWLQELLESPQVFIELAEGNVLHETRIPVTLINKTRSIADSYNGLFNVRLRYTFGFSKPQIRAY